MRKNFNLVWQNVLNPNPKSSIEVSPKTTTSLIKEVIRRGSEIRDQTIVIKLPSIIIEDDNLLTNFAENVQLISMCGAKIFIIHDQTNLVADTLKLFGCNEKFIDNISVVDHKSSQIIEMVISGYINKYIVSKLCNIGCYAIGISGKDANLIQAKKSKLIHKITPEQGVIDVGFISEPIMINPEILLGFEDSDVIPVISPIASDENGRTHLLDVNLTASIISSALDADHLILPCKKETFGEKNIKVKDLKFIQKILHSGNNDQATTSLIEIAINQIENNDNYVHFTNAEQLDSILLSIFTEEGTN